MVAQQVGIVGSLQELSRKNLSISEIVAMRISVVIPTYNVEKYISNCLSSIAKQSVRPFEVIIVDGLSKDRTLAAAEAFARILPLRVISEKDEGQADAVTKGLRLVRGDIAHWHAADDLVMPGAFESVTKAFKDPELDLVYSDGWAFDDLRLVRAPARWARFETAWLFFGRFQSDCTYWRHSLTAPCLPLDSKMPLNCDEDWFLRIWALSRKAKWLPTQLGAFRMRPAQLSQTLDRSQLERDRTISRKRVQALMGISDAQRRIQRLLWAPRYLVLDRFMWSADRAWHRLYRRGRELERRQEFLQFLLREWTLPPI
jgi:glycosyltransferase involved in cell wall biosynthesis